jgi:hypothetical protein
VGLVVADGARELLITRAPMDPGRLRDLERAAMAVERRSPVPAPGYPPPAGHPWRRITPGSALEAHIEEEHRAMPSTDKITDQDH